MSGEQGQRINVILDEEHALKLKDMAARMYLQPGTVARSLLARAIDQVDAEADRDQRAPRRDPRGMGTNTGRTRRRPSRPGRPT